MAIPLNEHVAKAAKDAPHEELRLLIWACLGNITIQSRQHLGFVHAPTSGNFLDASSLSKPI